MGGKNSGVQDSFHNGIFLVDDLQHLTRMFKWECVQLIQTCLFRDFVFKVSTVSWLARFRVNSPADVTQSTPPT